MKKITLLLTGGIGSGKTTVAKYLTEAYGIPVFYSDDEAKKLYDDPQILAEISKLLGENIISQDGSLDKKALANIIFNDDAKKLKLEAFIHPKVREKFRTWKEKMISPIVVMESAIALQNGKNNFDYVVLVDAPENERLCRVLKRDESATIESVSARMRLQVFDKLFVDFTIDNTFDFKESTDAIITKLYNTMEKKAMFAGSFDPFTNGHLAILKKACGIFDKVYLCIANNPDKKRKYPIEEMVNAIKETIPANNLTNCEVVVCDHLIAEFCKELDVKYIIRGLRDTTDYLYEETITKINHEINPVLETIYLRGENDVISSSMVREFIKYGKHVDKYVPTQILKLIQPK